jgi:phosphate transport system substrate-binding protein
MNPRFFVARSLFIVSAALALACGGERRAAETSTSASPGRRALTIKGSDTMVILGQRFAEEYMKANPGVVVQVNGGGSGTGIAALINGTVDLAQSSRPMKDNEIQDVRQKRKSEVKETPVALDALSVFVHSANSTSELTIEQLAGIYTGKITNWNQVGGKSARIVLYGRENSSGTYEYFKEHVLNKADFAPRVQTLQGTAAVINAVARDANAIGYGGIAYAKDVKAVGVKDGARPAVMPSEATVMDGTYPISRKLYFYSVESNNPEIERFISWATSPEGQAVVKNVGYFPLASAPGGTGAQ